MDRKLRRMKFILITFVVICTIIMFNSKITAETVKSKVTFNLNGGYFTNNFITEYQEGLETKLPTNVLKPGHTFIGWYEDESQAGEKQTIIPTTKTGDITYYAKWKLEPSKNAYVKVSGGMYHTLAIDVHGNLIGWGLNNNGQLGDETVLDKLTPTLIKEGTKFVEVSAGGLFSLALDEEGKLWGAGANGVGQLGDGTTVDKNTLVQITNSDGTKFTKISAGLTHSLAIDENGTLWTWGHNSKGELGNGTTTNSVTPIKIGEGTKVIEISAGNECSFAIDETGKLYAWGANEQSNLGSGDEETKLSPVLIEGDIVFKKVEASTGEGYTLAIDEAGNLYTWGANTYGQLGNGSFESKKVPTKIEEGKTFEEIDAGYNTSFAIDTNKNLWSFGANGNGELGDGTQALTNTPKQVLTNVTSVGASWNHTIMLTEDGSLKACGANENGELGSGDVQASLVPKTIAKRESANYKVQHYKQNLTLDGYDLVETENKEGAKESYAVAEAKIYEGFTVKSATSGRIREDGSTILKVYYDRNRENVTFETNGGFINSGNITNYIVGQETTLPTDVAKVGYNFLGWYNNPELTGEPVAKIASTEVGAKIYYAKWNVNLRKMKFSKVATGQSTSYAIDEEGKLWAWGYNSLGQLGCGNNNSNFYGPVQVKPETRFKEIASIGNTCLAIDEMGNLWAWGSGTLGNLGNGLKESVNTPIQIKAGTKFKKISVGYGSFALEEDGTLWAWGINNVYGQLGIGTVTGTLTPVKVQTNVKFKEIVAGGDNTLAIDEDGNLWGWGLAYELGIEGNTTSAGGAKFKIQTVPTKIKEGIKAIAGGCNHIVVIDDSGELYTAGNNTYGQLGNGTKTNSNNLTSISNGIRFSKVWSNGANGGHNNLAIDEAGNLYAWGRNSYGLLGDGTTDQRLSMISIIEGTKFIEVSNGPQHVLAIDEEGNLWGWGLNNYRQLGDGTTNNTTTPIKVSSTIKYKFKLELNLGDGTIEGGQPSEYEYGKEYVLPTPTKPGYIFGGWYDNKEFAGEPITSITVGESGDKSYYAKWEPRTDIAYKVEHYKQNDELNGYDLAETEELQGTMDSTVTATSKIYEGYMLNLRKQETVKSGTVVLDGSLTLKLYYDKLFEQNFNINIKNVDGYNGEAIANAKYDIIVEYIDGTTQEHLGNITDENGNISIANVSGKSTMRVYIKQVEQIEGYTENDIQRYVEVKVNSENRIELTGAKTSGIEANVEESTLNITYSSYTEKFSNTIRINTVDNVDNDIKVADVKFKVTFPDNETEDFTTDEDGMIEFKNIEPPAIGTFIYELEQISTPYGYKENKTKTYIAVSFNEAGLITKVQSFNPESAERNKTNITNEVNGNTQNIIANIDIIEERVTGEGSIFSDYDLKIIENDIDTNNVVKGVKYKITQKTTTGEMSSVVTANKTTDENGQIITTLTNGEQILLTIKRTKVPSGYKMLKQEIKIPLTKEADGTYALSQEVEGVTIDNDSKTITVNRNIYKIGSKYNTAKQKLNNTIYITKVDKYMRPLQGVTMQLREMTSGKTWDLTTDDDGLAKITSEELIAQLGSEFPQYLVTEKGKLTFWITEKTVPVGYERINQDIGFEAYYEVDPTGKMQISYMNVLDGLSYYHIVNQEYSEYEEEEYIQVDIKLKVMNNYSTDIVNLETDLKKFVIDKRGYDNRRITYYPAHFEVTFVHTSAGKIKVRASTNWSGILTIPNVYFPEGITNIYIREHCAPYGYRRIDKIMAVTVKNENGVIQVVDSAGTVKDNNEVWVIIKNELYGHSNGGGSGSGTVVPGGSSGGLGSSWIGGGSGSEGSGGTGGSSGSGGTGGSGGSGGIWGGSGSGGSGSSGGGSLGGSGGIVTDGGSGSGSGSGGSGSSGGGLASGGASGTGGPGGTTKPGQGSSSSPIRPSTSGTPIYGIQIDKVNKHNSRIRVKDALYMVTILNEETNEQTVKVINTNDTGKVLISDLTEFGNFKISILEVTAPDAYSLDEEKHEIRIHRDEESHMITVLDDDTSENTSVVVDNINKIVNMTIKETPKGIGLSILKQDYDDEEINLKNSKFEIIDDETNEKYELITGEEGGEYISLPVKEDGTHTFTIKELQAPQGYNTLAGNLSLSINYLKGKIVSATVSGANAEITNQNTEYIEINVLNTKKTEGIKYDIELIKADAYYSSITFENAKIKVDVDNENGMQGITKTALTNKDGRIYINDMYGTGGVSIRITELVPPPGRRFDIKEKQVLLNIDSETGWIKLTKGTSNVDVFIDNDTKKITVRVRNYPDGTFIIGANKVDAQDNDLILLGAKYNVVLEETGETFTVCNYINGLLGVQNIPMPNTETTGVYTYKITEVEAPFGYAIEETPVILKVEVGKISGINVITNAYIESGNAEVEKYGDEFIHVKLKDTALEGSSSIEPGEGYNIKVIKVDSEEKEYTIAGTLIGVHVQAESGESYYKELKTDEYGQINLNHIKGTGKVTVTLQELDNAPNYLIANGTKNIEFTRDSETKEITIGEITGNGVTASKTEENNVTIVFENTLDLTLATIMRPTKVWIDTDNQKVHRPENIKVQIKNGDTVVREKLMSSTAEGTIFTNLPKYDSEGNKITYTIQETVENEGDLKFYVSSIEGNVLTNTFRVPDDIRDAKTSVTARKVWVDTEIQKVRRPENIKVKIMNGETVVEEKVISNSAESVTFENLTKYDSDGNEIDYTIVEEEVAKGDLTFYVSSIDQETKTITNTFRVPDNIKEIKTDIVVNKVWVDTEIQKVHRPENIKIQIKNGETVVAEKIISNLVQSVIFENLQKYDENANEIAYTITEAEVNEGDLKFYASTVEGTTMTNTFTVPTDTISIDVNKVWVDTEEQRVHRPANIKVKVMNGETVVAEKVITSSESTVTFSGLTKYDGNGNEIVYRIVESAVNKGDLKFYISTVEGTTITNTFTVPTDTISIDVNKVWVDTEEQRVHRPESIKVKVMNGETVTAEKVITSSESTVTFSGLTKYDGNGNEIVYRIIESAVNEGDLKFYVSTVEGTTITNTFTVPTDTISIDVNKVWVDTEEQRVHRPANIKVKVMNGETVTAEKVITSSESTVTFSGLTKYDADGNEIVYRIVESAVNEGDLKFYVSTVEGTTITNTFTVPTETISIDVNKVWVDTEEQRVHRPANIKVKVMNGETVVAEKVITSSESTVTFSGLTKYDGNGNEIVYRIVESAVNEGDLKFYVSSVEGTTITNTFTVPEETISLEVNKIWIDTEEQRVHRPANIKIKIMNGQTVSAEKVITNSESRVTFEGLRKYDSNGNEITYTIVESAINEGDLKFYVSSIEGNVITNTFTLPRETVSLDVAKEWEDNNNTPRKRPESVIIVAKSGNNVIGQVELTVANALESNANTWKGQITNLPKYDSNGDAIVYTIDETEKNSGDLKFYVKAINQQTRTITNTFTVPDEKVSLDVTKEWKDNNNALGKRPASVIIVAKRDGINIGQVELTVANALIEDTNTWKGQITNLPKYDSNADEVVYEIDEIEKNSEDLKFYTTSINQETRTVTNTFIVPNEKVSLDVTKKWEDNNNTPRKRPESVIIVAKSGENTIGQVELTVANALIDDTNTWRGQITNLPKYDSNGDVIVYTIDETEKNTGDLKFYVKSINQETRTVINTFTVPDEKVSLDVTKKWEDNNNAQGKRPGSVIIVAKSGNNIIGQVELTVANTLIDNTNMWKGQITDLPKYDSNGDVIVYTIDETEKNSGDLKFYVKSINQETRTVTNTFTVPDERVSLDVTKKWEDNNNALEKRPESVIIVAKSGNNVIGQVELTVANALIEDTNTWKGQITNLQKYDSNGDVIVYTIDETEENSGDLKFYAKSINQETRTVTNTFTVPDERIGIDVTKKWEDNNNVSGRRPESVIIVAKRENNIVGQVELTVANALIDNTNIWRGQIINLPKYDSNGNAIVYEIDEIEKNNGDLKFYVKSIDQETRTVTNTFTVPDERVSLDVTKIWVDSNDKHERRPESVIIVAKSGNNIIGQVELTVANALTDDTNTWRGQITNLPKYDSTGNEIIYEIDEIEKNVGDLEYYSKTIDANSIINTLQLEKTKYKVEHYIRTEDEEVEGYICEEEYFEEYPGKFVTAVPKNYDGVVENISHPNRIPSGIVTKDGSLVLKLYYNRQRYSIKYVLNGGTAKGILQDKYTYGEEIYLSKRVTKEGFEFAGWYDNAECIGNAILKIEPSQTGEKVFYAKWRKEVIVSNNYIIDGVEKSISKVSTETTVEKFIQNIQSDRKISIKDLKGNNVTGNAIVGTGYKAVIENGEQTCEYEIAVRGDLDGNGKISITDISTLNQALTNKIRLEGIRKTAADIDSNGNLTVTDLSTLNQALIKKFTL